MVVNMALFFLCGWNGMDYFGWGMGWLIYIEERCFSFFRIMLYFLTKMFFLSKKENVKILQTLLQKVINYDCHHIKMLLIN